MAVVLKTTRALTRPRGLESHTLRWLAGHHTLAWRGDSRAPAPMSTAREAAMPRPRDSVGHRPPALPTVGRRRSKVPAPGKGMPGRGIVVYLARNDRQVLHLK